MVPSALQAPLVEDGFVVAAPDVPAKLKAGFTKAGAKVNVLDPGILRKHLSCGLDVDCDLESAPQSSLRRREWILEALRFCYDAERPELLQGLPLALLADGRLHTFGKTEREWVFLATTEQRELFANQSHWFIDPQFCEDAGLVTKARGPLRRMSLKDVVDAIVVVLGQRTTSQYMDWIPAGDDVPNEAWLLKLFRYLAKVQKGELADANIRTVLRSVCWIPDQHGHLHRAGQPGTPLLRPAEKAKASLISALSSLGLPLVTGSELLMSAIAQFSAGHTDLVRPLTANTAALALKATGLALTKFDANVHDAVVDFFANAFLAEDLTDQAATALAGLPIIPTNAGQLVAAVDVDVYLPPSFDVDVAFPATLVGRGLRDIRVPLLSKLGVKELTLSTVISRFIAQTYPKIAEDKRLSLLKWIKDVYYDLERGDGGCAAELRSVREALSRSEFVKCPDGLYRAAGLLYMPTAKVALEVLGESAATPCTKTYAEFDGSWADFFRKSGMAILPRPKSIVARVTNLSQNASGGDRRKALLKVAKCLGDEVDHFVKMPLPTGELLFEVLKTMAWLPAYVDDKVKDNPAFTRPARELFRPKEIYPRDFTSTNRKHPSSASGSARSETT